MKIPRILFLCLMLLTSSFSTAEAMEFMPNVGIILSSADLYEVSTGIILHSANLGISPNVVFNNNKVGATLSFFVKSDGKLYDCSMAFIRPRVEYYFHDDRPLNFLGYQKNVYGFDIGFGGSGSSLLINIFTGIRYEERSSDTSFVIGSGVNF